MTLHCPTTNARIATNIIGSLTWREAQSHWMKKGAHNMKQLLESLLEIIAEKDAVIERLTSEKKQEKADAIMYKILYESGKEKAALERGQEQKAPTTVINYIHKTPDSQGKGG
jgi:hypothetical protein